jgi:PKD domain
MSRMVRGRRRRWLGVAAVLVVAIPLAVVVTGTGKTARASEAAPVVDPNYIYGQLFDMSYNDVYRVSGADGDPHIVQAGGPDPWNLPPTVNGWQEFFLHWKQQLTDTSVMSNMAKFATVKDHYFRRMPEQQTRNPSDPDYFSFDPDYRWDSDDAEVTIPGATCAGQRVLLAAHPDGTPVTPTIVGQVNNTQSSTSGVFGFGAGRRSLTLSNLANGGAYDDTSGVTLTMGEYQALLRWYDANGTYPSKTLKITLLDADAGRAKDGTYLREGSKYYVNNLIPQGPQGQYAMFAEMNANGLSYPAYHLGTQYYWNNLTGGGVGPWHTFITDTPSAPNPSYPDTSGAIAANSAAISAFNSDLANAVTAGFAQQSTKYGGTVTQENPLRYNGTGSVPGGLASPLLPTQPSVPAYSASDQATYSPVHAAGTAPESEILSTEDPAAAFWQKGIPGFSVGGDLDSNSVENPYASSVSSTVKSTPILAYTGGGTSFELGTGVPAAGMSTLTAATAVGATSVTVANGGNFTDGQPFFIDTGSNLETGVITGTSGNTITLGAPLNLAHASGVPFNVDQGQPVGFTGDTLEHLNFFASGAPHGLGGETAPTQELLRALELPAQYTSLLVSGNNYLGSAPKPTGTVAYFESTPVNPAANQAVTFDASFSRAKDGGTAGLQYYWDFGDGTHATGETVTHTFSGPQWADVKLVVVKGQSPNWGMYRQAVAVGSPGGSPPATPACGTFSPSEQAALIAAAKEALR